MAKLTHFSELRMLPQEDPWFQVYELLGGIFAIFEPYHFQEVISYLILGNEKALLLDTGMGIGDMRALVRRLTDLPLTVVNSHSHFDHTGGNWQFDAVHLFDLPEAVQLLTTGFTLPEEDENLTPEAYQYPGELWFNPAALKVRPCRIIPIREGHVFDLGGRTLRVIHTPGHSDDSIMLADDQNRLLFTGDTVYPAPLYAHLSQSNLDTYTETIRELADPFASYTLICSHNNPIWEGTALADIENAFREVQRKKQNAPGCGVQQYSFGDFSIIA